MEAPLNLSFIFQGLSRRRGLLPLQLHTGISVLDGADDAGHFEVIMEWKEGPFTASDTDL